MTQALLGVWFAKRRKIPNDLYVQDLWPENVEIVTGIHSKAVLGPISRMVNYIYKRCDAIFATSPSFVTDIQKRCPGQEQKVHYLPQYAEDFYKPVPSCHPERSASGVEGSSTATFQVKDPSTPFHSAQDDRTRRFTSLG